MSSKIIIAVIVISALLVSLVVGVQVVWAAEASAAGSSSVDWWSMFHHDLGHTGYSTSNGPVTNQTLWTFTTGGSVTTSPAVVDGKVYFGSDDGSIYAVNAYDGALIWNFTTEGPAQSSPAIVDGVVYAGGYRGHMVFAINASTGTLLWKSPINSLYPNTISATAVANGLVYIDVHNADALGGELYAFNATTGTIAWTYQPVMLLSSSPAVVGDMVYIGNEAGVIVSLDAISGNVIWSYYVRGAIGSNSTSGGGNSVPNSLTVANGLVYVGTPAEMIQALNASSGAFVWSASIIGGSYLSCPAVAYGKIYVGMAHGGPSEIVIWPPHSGVCALDAATGALAWNRTLGSIFYSSPAVAGGVVYVGSDSAALNYSGGTGPFLFYALNATTGTTLWTYSTGGSIVSSPAVANGVVYVGSNDGKVYAFGSPQTSPQSPSLTPTSSPTASPSVPEFTPVAALVLVGVACLIVVALRKKRWTLPRSG